MPTKPTYESAIDFGSMFDEDWQRAQSRYQSGLNAGYDPATAETLYLKPIQAKWKIIQSNPDEFQSKDKLDKISEEFDSATTGSIRNLTAGEDLNDAVAKRFGPLVQRWSIASVKPEMSTEQQYMVRDLSQEINRLKSKRGTYTRELTNMQLDPASRQAKAQAVTDINGQLEDLQAEYQQALRGGTREAEPAPVQSPFQRPVAFAPPPETAPMPNLYGTGSPDIQMPAPAPFVERVAAMTPPPEPAGAVRRPITFISGRPDLSNVSREEADAAWAARFNRPQRPTPVDREEVESPAEKSYDSAAQVKADFKAGNISRQKAVQILKDKFGLE